MCWTESRSKSCRESEARLADAPSSLTALVQSVDEAGDTSPQTVPAVDVLGLNTNARHTFHFSSSSQ